MIANKTFKYTRLWLLVTCSILAASRVEAFMNNHHFKIEPYRSISTKTELHLTPLTKLTIASTVGHVIGGITGTPFVIQATKKGGWYRRIDLPKWTPPNAIFGPVWSSLYAAMGVAFSRVYYVRGFQSLPVYLWMIHYLLNLSWSYVFFGTKRLRPGLLISWGMLVSLAAVIPLYWRIDRLAGMLLLPYAAWLIFATALNREICRLNPTVNGYNDAMFQSDLLDLQKKAAAFANS